MPSDEITSSFGVQILDFLDADLLQETLQNSEVTSGLNCQEPDKTRCYQDNTGSTPTNQSNINHNNNNNNNNNNNDFSIIFDEFGNDISASIDFSSSPQFPTPASHLLGETVQEIPETNNFYRSSVDPLSLPAGSPSKLPLQESLFQEEGLCSIQNFDEAFNASSPSCSFLGSAGLPTGLPSGLPGYMNMNRGISAEASGIFSSSILPGSNLLPQDLMVDYQNHNGGIFCPESMQGVFASGSTLHQVVGGGGVGGGGGECQAAMMGGAGAPAAAGPLQLRAEISGLDDPSFTKVEKLSIEQRKEKIHKYLKKKNQRNFNKKIKYACRKTLADSRPRVRGRFAKNDEFGEAQRLASSSHNDYDNDDEVEVKEEDQMVDPSDIYAHISGVSSFKRTNHSIQTWIRDTAS